MEFMKRYTLLLVLVLLVAFTTSVFAQKYAILKPTTKGVKSEAIPISKKQLDQLMKNDLNANMVFNATHMGVIDTIAHSTATDVNWGVAVGDTNSSYYEPSAACFIKAIGVVGQTWSTSSLASGFNLMIHKAANGWDFADAKWAGAGCPTKDSLGYASLLGTKMWGDFPASVVDGQRVWTEMIFLGYEPDSQGEGFVVSVVPFGDGYMGTDAQNYTGASDIPRVAKYYQAGWTGHQGQFVVRNYQCTWLLVVEFYQNTAPNVVPSTYSTVLSADARTLAAHVDDIDANDPAQAGAATVNLYYKVNDGAYTTVAAALASGADTDGMWEATVPANILMPGDILTYKWDATDKAGMMTTSGENSYGYFAKANDLLVFYNDDGTSYDASIILHPYYDNLWLAADGTPYAYDVWVGLADGPVSNVLIDQYNYIVQLDVYSPATLNDDVYGAWFAAGSKNLFWSSQEWAGNFCGGWAAENDTTFAADDWHNMYMGLEYVGGAGHDVAADPFPVVPAAGDGITGDLAAFLADSLTLYINTNYELGWTNWGDAVTAAAHAVVCFTDSAQGRTMGLHTEQAGSKTVFLTFDPLTLDTAPGYWWTEPNVSSIVGKSLLWFGLPSDVEETTPGVVTSYDLNQNYPNPFNPETKITYSISQPGLVKLSVYNVLGQKVADLVNEQKAPATYHVTWNAKDMASGVYFYRIEAGDFSKTMKMMLLR